MDALERAVRLDPASTDHTAMLAFAYLLLSEEEREARGSTSAALNQFAILFEGRVPMGGLSSNSLTQTA